MISETIESCTGRGSNDPVNAHRIDVNKAVLPAPLLHRFVRIFQVL